MSADKPKSEILKNVLSKLKKVKEYDDYYMALCPVHDDKNPSLQLSEGEDGKTIITCHANCNTEDVVKALGLQMKDLFPENIQKTHEKSYKREYVYRDSKGTPYLKIVRDNRKFLTFHYDTDKKEFLKGKGNKKAIPYNLPEVVKSNEIYVVEGEKDAEKLKKHGLTATTNPYGAGKWKDELNQYFKGKKIVILPDNDEEGIKHAENVARKLKPVVSSLKMVKLWEGPKEDVTDWLAKGKKLETLLKEVEKSQEYSPAKLSKKESNESEEEKRNIKTSFYIEGNKIFEQTNEGYFVEYDVKTEEIKVVPCYENEGEVIEPLDGEDVEYGAVTLPSNVTEYGNMLELINEIEDHIYKYLDLTPFYLKFATYYVVLTWLYDCFYTLPYLRALGDTGCGKSRFLDVVGNLCYKPLKASGCVTPAPIHRMLRRWGGTLILDEADMRASDEYHEVVTILNCGFEKGRPVIRALKDNPDQIQILPVFGPKVFATRHRFNDAALEARCLTEVMEETDRTNIPAVLSKTFFEEQQELRNKLLLFRLRNYFNIDPEAGNEVDLGEIEPRLRQISEAFVSLFANEKEVLQKYKHFIQAHQRELIEQRASTKEGQVVEKLFEVLKENGMEVDVPSVTSVPTPGGESEQIGTDISAGDIAERAGLSSQAVGSILKKLGLETKKKRTGSGNKRAIILDKEKLQKLKRRYIPQQENVPSPQGSTPGLGTIGTLEQESLVSKNDLTPSQKSILEEYEENEDVFAK